MFPAEKRQKFNYIKAKRSLIETTDKDSVYIHILRGFLLQTNDTK